MEKEYSVIDKFFEFRQEDFLEDIGEDRKFLKNKIKNGSREQISKIIDTVEDKSIKEQLKESFDSLVADYNIKLAYYNKKYYKQGFDDAVMLNKICDK